MASAANRHRRSGLAFRLAAFALLLGALAVMPAAQAFLWPAGRLPEVAQADLPPEAVHTLRLIRQGGPFPYRKDGVVFGNREKHLPRQTRGYYREYTVPTPGSRDRGARRIVAGEGRQGDVRSSGEYYYSDDHYRSFRRIRP